MSLHTKNQHPRLSRSPRKVREAEEEEEKRRRENNNSVNSGHYVCHAVHLQCCMGSTRTSLKLRCWKWTGKGLEGEEGGGGWWFECRFLTCIGSEYREERTRGKGGGGDE